MGAIVITTVGAKGNSHSGGNGNNHNGGNSNDHSGRAHISNHRQEAGGEPGGKLTRTSPAATTTTTITLLPTPATGGNSFSYILVVEGGGRGDLEIFLLKI